MLMVALNEITKCNLSQLNDMNGFHQELYEIGKLHTESPRVSHRTKAVQRSPSPQFEVN